VWPHPLNLDYGEDLAVHPIGGWWCGLFLVALAAATALAIYRRSALGFLGAWFFAILAPSSSVVPLLTQTIAEHRMYLPLAALAVLAVAAVQRRLRHHGAYVPIRLNLAYELAKSPRTDTRGDSPARHRPAVGSRQRHGAQ
jgi:hypothetical protein